MGNPSADYPSALHTNTDISAFSAINLGASNPTHTQVEGKQEEELLAIEAKLGIGASLAASASTGYVLTKQSNGTTAWAAVSGGITDVSDTSTVNLTLTGSTISADVIPSGIDHGAIGGLVDDDHTQYIHTTPGSDTRNVIQASGNFIGLSVKGNSAQSGTSSIFQVRNSSNTIFFNIVADGTWYARTTASPTVSIRSTTNATKGSFNFENGTLIINGATFEAYAPGDDTSTLQFGLGAAAELASATAIGDNSLAQRQATAVGRLAKAYSASSSGSTIAVGYNSTAGASGFSYKAVAIGANAVASQDFTLAFGYGAAATAANSSAFGGDSLANGLRSIAHGPGATSSGDDSLSIGYQALTNSAGDRGVALGSSSEVREADGIAVGYNGTVSSTHTASIIIGSNLSSTAANQLLLGGATTTYINDVYFGGGVTNTNFTNAITLKMQVTGASGTNITGSHLQINGSKGTGTGIGGSVYIFTAPAIASGSTPGTLVERVNYKGSGEVVWNDTALDYDFRVESDSAYDALFIDASNDATHIMNNASGKISFFGVTAVTRQTELTDELTTITHSSPGTPDYAISAPVDSSGGASFGFASADEFNTVMSVIANLQTRQNETETKLTAYGLFQDAD